MGPFWGGLGPKNETQPGNIRNTFGSRFWRNLSFRFPKIAHFLKPDLVTQPPSAFAHGYLQSLPLFSGMPVQRNPRSSAGPTASGLPLEPQSTIPLLSEQEAQDPAVT